jgi:hypothetical protein
MEMPVERCQCLPSSRLAAEERCADAQELERLHHRQCSTPAGNRQGGITPA